MVWLWARGAQELEVLTQYDSGGYFILKLTWPDGRSEVERFPDLATFKTRLLALEQELHAASWKNTGPPVILPEGWPHRPLR